MKKKELLVCQRGESASLLERGDGPIPSGKGIVTECEEVSIKSEPNCRLVLAYPVKSGWCGGAISMRGQSAQVSKCDSFLFRM
jgi:hypothetical protein